MDVSNGAGKPAVHFLGEWGLLIASAQPRLDMPHGHACVESGKAGGERGGGIAMHKDKVGLLLLQHALETREDIAGDVVQILSGLHDVQIVLRHDVEQIEHLVQHLPVLRGDANDGLNLTSTGLQALDQRRHLDGFRAGAKNEHDFHRFPSLSSAW